LRWKLFVLRAEGGEVTDREAIRRLASILHARVAGEEQPELVLDWIDRLMVDLAEPAAPTVTATCTDCGRPITHLCTAPTVTRESRFEEALKIMDRMIEELPAYPPVTREQVTEVVTPALAVWVRHSVKMTWEDELGAMPHLPEWPAFFRAVADALDKP
jgi:hypothetical protein